MVKLSVEERIINCLKRERKRNPRDVGLTIAEISRRLRLSRITVTKYVHGLIKEGKLEVIRVGVAKLIRLKE